MRSNGSVLVQVRSSEVVWCSAHAKGTLLADADTEFVPSGLLASQVSFFFNKYIVIKACSESLKDCKICFYILQFKINHILIVSSIESVNLRYSILQPKA